MVSLMVWCILAITKYNHIRLWTMSALAHFADAGGRGSGDKNQIEWSDEPSVPIWS